MVGVFVCFLAGCAAPRTPPHTPTVDATSSAHTHASEDGQADLGRFSISLNVKDIGASRACYEELCFRAVDGDQAKNWLVMENQTSTIGLFKGCSTRAC